jgi:hypothetical protein
MEPDIEGLVAELDRAEREVEELVGGLTEEQLNWQPPAPGRGGRGWSVAQAIEHLSITNDVYITAVVAALWEARARGGRERKGPIRLPWFGRWFVGQLEPQSTRKLKAVGKTQPPSNASQLEVLGHFRAAQANVRGHLRQNADLDLNGIRFRNPLLPLLRFTCGTAFHILNAHNRRHLAQARRVVESPGFPR